MLLGVKVVPLFRPERHAAHEARVAHEVLNRLRGIESRVLHELDVLNKASMNGSTRTPISRLLTFWGVR